MKDDLGITLLMLQNVARDGGSVYPSKVLEWQWKTDNCRDPLGAIMDACDRHGVDFFSGIGFPAATGVAEGEAGAGSDWYECVSGEFLDCYGDHCCFKGWYVAGETAIENGRFNPAHVAFTARMCELWRKATPNLPILASPFFCGGERTIADASEFSRDIEAMGCDIIAYQDGVGCSTGRSRLWNPEGNARLFERLAEVHARTPVRLWANVELFEFENGIFFQPLLPAPFERVQLQLESAAPFVERVVAYTVPGLMTSQVVCPGLGVPQTETLYQDCKQYLKKVRGEP